MKPLSNYLAQKYFKCQKKDKTYWLDLFLKAHFKEQKLK